jgi:hypothetical protein
MTDGPDSPDGAAVRRGWLRRAATALRSLTPATMIALTLAIVLGGAGGAAAANGGSFLLGKANTETATASLANSKGTPLKLSAPKGTAPLIVNRKALVTNLNADYLHGFTYDQLALQGGDGISKLGTVIPVDDKGELVASTGHLTPGNYYVTATAEVDVRPGDLAGFCYISKGSSPQAEFASGGATGPAPSGIVQASEVAFIAVDAGDTLQEYCSVGGTNGSSVLNAGIIGVRVIFFSGTEPVHDGTAAKPRQQENR